MFRGSLHYAPRIRGSMRVDGRGGCSVSSKQLRNASQPGMQDICSVTGGLPGLQPSCSKSKLNGNGEWELENGRAATSMSMSFHPRPLVVASQDRTRRHFGENQERLETLDVALCPVGPDLVLDPIWKSSLSADHRLTTNRRSWNALFGFSMVHIVAGRIATLKAWSRPTKAGFCCGRIMVVRQVETFTKLLWVRSGLTGR